MTTNNNPPLSSQDLTRFADSIEGLAQVLSKVDQGLATNNAGSNAQVNLHVGGVISAASISITSTLFLIVLICLGWMMLRLSSMQDQIHLAAQLNADRQQAWVGVWNKKLAELEAVQNIHKSEK